MAPYWSYLLVIATISQVCVTSGNSKQHCGEDHLCEMSENTRGSDVKLEKVDSGVGDNYAPPANKMDSSWSPNTYPLKVIWDMLAMAYHLKYIPQGEMVPGWSQHPFLTTVLQACAARVNFKQNYRDDTLHEVSENTRGSDVKLEEVDRGHGVNCGPPDSKMDFNWSPKVLHKSMDTLTVTLDMLAPVDLHSGAAQLNVTFKEEPDGLIYNVYRTGKCQHLQGLGFQNPSCPVKKNDHLKASIKKTNLRKFPESGEFTVTMVITNENKDIFLCIKADIVVEE